MSMSLHLFGLDARADFAFRFVLFCFVFDFVPYSRVACTTCDMRAHPRLPTRGLAPGSPGASPRRGHSRQRSELRGPHETQTGRKSEAARACERRRPLHRPARRRATLGSWMGSTWNLGLDTLAPSGGGVWSWLLVLLRDVGTDWRGCGEGHTLSSFLRFNTSNRRETEKTELRPSGKSY